MSRRPFIVLALSACLLAGAATAQQTSEADRLASSLAGLKAQRPGVVDAYVVAVALDSDPVFNREAREAGRVLARRFDAEGRTIVLAADEGEDKGGGIGSPESLASALARAAELMDRKEDVLVLYSTSHGSPRAGLNYRDEARGSRIITPTEFATLLADRGFENRLIILQACFSGQFVPALAAPRTVIVTAASATRSSFGCTADNDWTFFGHALVNLAMRKPDTLVRQVRRAFVSIYGWENKLRMESSNPEISIGSDAMAWMSSFDARMPTVEGVAVGRPPSELDP